jgi:DNA-binding MarR family transcriptional regulator
MAKKAPDAVELAVFATSLYQLVERLRAEHEEAAAAAGVTAAQAAVLTMLSEPQSMAKLAERMGCDASNITGLVDRLEAKGLVVRSADEGDRRVKRIRWTPQGKVAVERFQRDLIKTSSLAKLSPKARRGLLAALSEAQRPGT